MAVPSRLPYGLTCGHTWAEAGAFLEFLERARPRLVVEIGVHEGGFGSLLVGRLAYDAAMRYVGIEIDQGVVRWEFKGAVQAQPRAALWYGDCFDGWMMSRVADALLSPGVGPALVYCDGGDKLREMGVYARLIRPGDWIGLHDFWAGPGHDIDGMPGYGTDPATWKPEVTPADFARLGADLADIGFKDWPRAEPELFARSRTVILRRPA